MAAATGTGSREGRTSAVVAQERRRLGVDQASGAVPTAPAGLAATGRIPIQQYAFLPTELTISAGMTVTWSNEDEAVHRVTATDKS